MALPSGSRLGPYEIASPIGAGGMGEVYRAIDTRLDRAVALKLLPANYTQNAERVRRFMQEAKAASALNHPNIITVHDIGESDTGRFLVMELVAGRTLRAAMLEERSTATLLNLCSQIAKALSAAHAAGITHRDVKPDNIMVRDDGYVKVLDFGLARLLPTTASESDADSDTLGHETAVGALLGTVAYMSPEQARGEAVSHPSDVFSLGVIFYEMATGEHPFKAGTPLGYLSAIALQTPTPPARVKPEIPAALDALILRMLEKKAAQRPTASEVVQALQDMERSSSGSSASLGMAGVASVADEGFWVAVLPFKYKGADAELAALAEGLSEDIVTGLSRFSYLRVIARSSTSRYATGAVDVRTAGQELGARYVLEGSLRQAGSRLRIAAQLIDATTGAHLWAENYDRAFSSDAVFDLQDDVVPRIVSTVGDTHGVLPHSMSVELRNKPPELLTPYEALLRGFAHFLHLNAEQHAAARAGLERAVEQAPGHADCWAMLAILYKEEYAHGFNVRPDPLGRALVAARRAIEIAPSNHLGHHALAVALFLRREMQAFRIAADRAIALNPMDGFTIAYMGFLIAYSGDWPRGCALSERAMSLNPHHPGWYWFTLMFDAYRRRDYRGALEFALKVDMPDFWRTNMALAAAYGELGDSGAARKALDGLLALRPDFAALAREELRKWWEPELVEHLLDGLRKAGLDVVPPA